MSQQFWFNFIFVWLAIMAVLADGRQNVCPELICGVWKFRWKKSWAYMAFWPIYFTVVFTIIRYDGYLYRAVYYSLPASFSGLIQNFNLSESGNLYKELEILVRCIFGTDYQAWRIVLGLAHMIPVVSIFRKYSESYLFSLFIFAAFGCHQAWMMNGMRQFLAVVIIFATTPWMLEKKYVKVVIAILIASRIHTSAFIMLPLVFVCSGSAWNKKTMLMLVASVCAMTVFANVTGAFDSLLVGTEYEGTEASMKSMGDDGMNAIRALVYAIPTIIAFMGRRRIQAEGDPVANLCVNMSIANLGVSLIAVVTSGVMVGRLPIYTNMYNYMIMPYLIRRTFGWENAKAVTVLAVIFYMAFYLYESGAI